MAKPTKSYIGRSWAWLTGDGASLVALGGFICVSIVATAMGFSDLRMANSDAQSLTWAQAAPIWLITAFVVLTMVAALNAALGVGLKPINEPIAPPDDSTPESDAQTLRSVPAYKARSKSKQHKSKTQQKQKTTRFRKSRLMLRVLAWFFYFFFAFWSVGFGYGFFWKELAGQEYTQKQFRTAIENVSNSVRMANDALETVETSVIDAAATARSRADQEASVGGTCANRVGSPPGDGPLTRARFAFADRAQALQEDVSQSWIARLSHDRQVLEQRVAALSTGKAPDTHLAIGEGSAALLMKLASVAELSSQEREQVFAIVFDDARTFVSQTNGLRQIHAEAFADRLDLLAADVGPDPSNPNQPNPDRADDRSYCWDTVLTEKLHASAQSLRALPDMPDPKFEFTEGPKATRAAFFNLARAAAIGVTTPVRLIQSKFTGQPPASPQLDFGEKEYFALFASMAVDMGVLFLTVVRAHMVRDDNGPRRTPRTPTPMRLTDVRNAMREEEFGQKSDQQQSH